MNEKTSKITLIGWMISIIIPAVIGTISVSQNFTKELKTFFMITICFSKFYKRIKNVLYDHNLYYSDHCI